MEPRRTSGSHVTRAVVLALTGLFLAVSLQAQETRGRITGRVLDPSKAPIGGASVTVTDAARGTTASSTTNTEGLFQVNYLLPGTYQVTVESTGFKKHIQDKLQLQISETRDLAVVLEVGGLEEAVSVVADASSLITSDASMGFTVDSKRIAELPADSRRSVQDHGPRDRPRPLGQPAPGPAVRADAHRRLRLRRHAQQPQRPADRRRAEHVHGQRQRGDRELRPALRPGPGVQGADRDLRRPVRQHRGRRHQHQHQVRDEPLHGSVYYFAEPKSLAANDFFGNARGQERPDTSSNRPGFTLTGPVRIPGLYDGRDRTFFTVGYERIKDVRPRFDAAADSWVPTEALRNGDFSEYASNITIYDPLTRVPTGTGQFVGQPFPGNVIPANRISPVAKAILEYYSPAQEPRPGRQHLRLDPAGDGRLQHLHRPASTRRSRAATRCSRAVQLVQPRQQLQRVPGLGGLGHLVPVPVVPGRDRRRARLQPDDRPERPVRLQPLRAQLGPAAGRAELRPDPAGLPRAVQHAGSRGQPVLPAPRLRREHHDRRGVRQRLPADHLAHGRRHPEQGAGRALAEGRHGDADLPRGQPVHRQRPGRPVRLHQRLHPAEQRQRHGLPGPAELRRRSCSGCPPPRRSCAPRTTPSTPRPGASSCRTTGGSAAS